MQSGVDGVRCFGCGGDNVPCETTGGTSLVTPRTERFSRRTVIEIIARGHWCVISTYLCLPQLKERSNHPNSGQVTLTLLVEGGRCAQYPTSRVPVI